MTIEEFIEYLKKFPKDWTMCIESVDGMLGLEFDEDDLLFNEKTKQILITRK